MARSSSITAGNAEGAATESRCSQFEEKKGDEESGEGVPKKWRSASASAEKMISASASAEKMIEDDVLVTAYAIPVSDISNRLLLGQFDLNQTFPKTYANPNPVTNPPVQHMSINSAFHGIPDRCIFSVYIILGSPFQVNHFTRVLSCNACFANSSLRLPHFRSPARRHIYRYM